MTTRLARALRIALGVILLLGGLSPLAADVYGHVHHAPDRLGPIYLGVGVSIAVLGALLIDREDVAAALVSVVDAAKQLLPWKSGGSPPPAPPPPPPSGAPPL